MTEDGMKYLISAIAVAIAAPLAAQQAQPAQPAAPANTAQTTTSQTTTTMPTNGATSAAPMAEPNGGYAPAEPALKGTPQPGSPIVFQPAPPPAVAFPAPAPLDHYPVCKRGRTDQCREPNSPSKG